MKKITKPGVYEGIPMAVYNTDPCPLPSARSSVLNTLLSQSPRHAWENHPRLNPRYRDESKKDFDLANAAHGYLLEGEAAVHVVEADSFKTKAAREVRDKCYEEGLIPLLPEQMERVTEMVAAARKQIAAHPALEWSLGADDGKAETTIVWKDGKHWRRARPDWLPNAGPYFYDYKTTTNANPEAWGNSQLWAGPHIQGEFAAIGIKATLGWEHVIPRWIVQENTAPFALTVLELSTGASDLAERQVAEAMRLWDDCLDRDRWPGYPARVCQVEAPARIDIRWTEREERDRYAREVEKKQPLDLGLHWQAPPGFTDKGRPGQEA
jgi:hypothetical protein